MNDPGRSINGGAFHRPFNSLDRATQISCIERYDVKVREGERVSYYENLTVAFVIIINSVNAATATAGKRQQQMTMPTTPVPGCEESFCSLIEVMQRILGAFTQWTCTPLGPFLLKQ